MPFSLLTEPWIPLISVDGTRKEASLTDALLEPQRWRASDSSIPVDALSLHRLLLAIAHRAIGPELDPRIDLLSTWPRQKIQSYLERWRDHFDLLHPKTPFLQVAALANTKLTPSPWTRLALDRSSGAARLLWDHSVDGSPVPLGLSEVARLLIAHLQFTPGGLVKALRTSAVRGPASGLLVLLPVGETLQETLCLSLVPQAKSRYVTDLPAWERPQLTVEELRAPKVQVLEGPAHRYTLLSRAVLLQPFGDRLTHLLYAEGVVATDASSPAADPMAAVVETKKGPMPLLLSQRKALWRDFQALVGSGGATPAATLNHASAVRQELGDRRPIDLLAGGLLPDQAKILLWRLEERRIAPALLQKAGLIHATDRALELAEEGGAGLNKALYALFSQWLEQGGQQKPDPKTVRGLQDSVQASASYWSALEPAFWSLVHELGTTGESESALLQWRKTLEAAVRDAWQQATRSLGLDGRALAAAGKSNSQIGKLLAGLRV